MYEELYHLKKDPAELYNLISKPQYYKVLNMLRNQWKSEITKARGSGKAEVFRYTNDAFPNGLH